MTERQTITPGLIGIAYALVMTHVGGPTNDLFTIASVLLAGASCYKLLPVFSGKPFRWSPVYSVMCGYLVWLTLLTYISVLPENSLLMSWLLASVVLVTWLVADMDRRSWLYTLALVCITGLVSAVWGIGQFVVTASRAYGPIVDPSSWGSINNILFFATVYVALTTRQRSTLVVALILGALFALASACAYSRVGTVIFFAGVGFIVLVCSRQRALRKRLLIIASIAVLAYGAVLAHASLAQAAGHSEGYTLDLKQKGWSQRLAIWQGAWDIYKEHPLLGAGTGTFKVLYPAHRNPGDMQNLGNFVHNDYLQFLMEGGPLLLGFLLALVGMLLLRLVPAVRDVWRGGTAGLETVLLTVAMGGLLTHALMTFTLYMVQNVMVLGLLLGRYINTAGLLRDKRIQPGESPRLVQGAVVLGAALVLLVPLLDALSRDLVVYDKRVPVLRDIAANSTAYVNVMALLTTIRSGTANNHFAMATIYRTTFDSTSDAGQRHNLGIATALEYQAGLDNNPFNFKVRQYYAEFLELNPWLMKQEEITATPEQLYKTGTDLYPVYIGTWVARAEYLHRIGRNDEGYHMLIDKALPWARLEFDNTYDIRHHLFLDILRSAKARGDKPALEKLLAQM